MSPTKPPPEWRGFRTCRGQNPNLQNLQKAWGVPVCLMKILTTGGAGYIGSHTCVELLQAGYEVVVVDNLSNSHVESLERVQRISGRSLSFYRVDLLDKPGLTSVFRSHAIDAVIHFAGLKAVAESSRIPLHY